MSGLISLHCVQRFWLQAESATADQLERIYKIYCTSCITIFNLGALRNLGIGVCEC